MNDPSVSVIIPVYMASRTIGRALNSVLAQTRSPDEIVIVDDGSPDEEKLLAALGPYRHRILYIRQPNGGAARARNLGIDRSRGELIAFLDADDYWEPTKVACQLDIFRAHPEVGLVASRFFSQVGGTATEARHRVLVEAWFGGFPENRVVRASGEQVYRMAMAVWTSTVVLRRGALGDRRFDSGLRTAEDRDLWIRLLSSCPVYMISDPLATGILEPGSLSRSGVEADFTNMIQVLRRHRDLLKPHELRDWEKVFFRNWAACHLGEVRPSAALGPAWERLRRDLLSIEGWWILMKCVMLAYLSARSKDRPPGHEMI